MSRLPVYLGLLALLALAGMLVLGGGPHEDAAPDGTRASTWPADDTDEGEDAAKHAPVLRGAPGAGVAGHADDAAPSGPPRPTSHGPFEIVALAAETEIPLDDVALTDVEGQPLGATNEDGVLVVERAASDPLVFLAHKDGYVTRRGRAAAGATTRVLLHLGVRVAGRVVRAASGKPVANAQLVVWDEDVEHEVAALVTDAEGRFRIDALRPHTPLQFIVRTPGLVPHVHAEMLHVAVEDLVIRIGDGGRLLGYVTDPDQRALAGREVRLLPAWSPIAEHRPEGDRAERARARLEDTKTAVTHTDEKGRYEFVGVPLDEFVQPVVVVTPRYVARPRGVARFREIDETSQLDIVVADPASLRIHVQDHKGAPLGHADVRVTAGREHWPLTPSDRDEAGGYLLEGLAPTRIVVEAHLPGAPSQRAEVGLVSGRAHEVRLAFRGRGVLEGVVVDKRGEPIWKADVRWTDGPGKLRARVRTDERGRFRFERLLATEGTLYVVARDLPWTPWRYEGRTFERLTLGGQPLRITLLDGTRAVGRFAELPPGTVVSSTIAGGTDHEAMDHHLKEDGRFVRRGPSVESGALFVFRARGFAPLLVDERRRPFTSEEVRDLGVLSFETTNPREGKVLDELKRPVHGALVRLEASWTRRSTRTDVDGDFAFARLPDRDVPAQILAEGFPPTPTTLLAASQFHRQVMRIRRSPYLFVYLQGPATREHPEVYVRARELGRDGVYGDGRSRPAEQTRAGRVGRLVRFHLPPGDYRIDAFQPGSKVGGGLEKVEVRPGPPIQRTLRLGQGR